MVARPATILCPSNQALTKTGNPPNTISSSRNAANDLPSRPKYGISSARSSSHVIDTLVRRRVGNGVPLRVSHDEVTTAKGYARRVHQRNALGAEAHEATNANKSHTMVNNHAEAARPRHMRGARVEDMGKGFCLTSGCAAGTPIMRRRSRRFHTVTVSTNHR